MCLKSGWELPSSGLQLPLCGFYSMFIRLSPFFASFYFQEAVWFGGRDEYVAAGSDCGSLLIWERSSGALVKAFEADKHILNCVQPSPSTCLLATSGIEHVIRYWEVLPEIIVRFPVVRFFICWHRLFSPRLCGFTGKVEKFGLGLSHFWNYGFLLEECLGWLSGSDTVYGLSPLGVAVEHWSFSVEFRNVQPNFISKIFIAKVFCTCFFLRNFFKIF